ncbi:hypothetical protein KAW18_10020 [candidate division WOR-3 bacterium]|nr:hypothetical protein [candidate division WOR-3 bacterium]
MKRSEGKGSDSEEASGSEGEIQKQSMENLSYTESFIYPLEQVEYIKI